MMMRPAPGMSCWPGQPPAATFTVAQANRALPYVRRIVRDAVTAHDRLTRLQARMEPDEAQSATPTDAPTQAPTHTEYEQALQRLRELVEELNQVGVRIRDFEKGVVDFPATHEHRPIVLCWTLDEPRVEYWHEINAGHDARQPVALLEPATADPS